MWKKTHAHHSEQEKPFLQTHKITSFSIYCKELFCLFACLFCFGISSTYDVITVFVLQNTLEGNGKLHILFLFFVALMFFISLWSLFGYHLYLTGNNKTTLGKFYEPAEHCIIYLTCVAVKNWLG